jgi:asparagine synthase (glutamine-hydrolysing)
MLRYMAVVWDGHSSEQSAAAQLLEARANATSPGWIPLLRTAGVTVMCAGITKGATDPIILPRGLGVVLGTLFRNKAALCEGDSYEKAVLGGAEADSIVASAGRLLVRAFWGNYVAFLVDPESDTVRVLKDPTGDLPCYTSRFSGVSLFYSYVSDCVDLGVLPFSINWDYVVARVVSGPMGCRTGVNGIAEIHRGHCAEIRNGRLSVKQYWNPLAIAELPVIEDHAYASTLVRLTTMACTQAWRSCYSSIIHQTSGGLDSSIVFSCLRAGAPNLKITCLTLYVPDGRFDERPWARAVTASFKCGHIEHPRNPRTDLGAILNVVPSAGVESLSVFLETGQLMRDIAREMNAPAVFSGNGGDFVFGSQSGAFAAFAYLSRNGVGPGLFRVAKDLALLSNGSVWDVLRRAALARLFRSKRLLHRTSVMEPSGLVSPTILRKVTADTTFCHPWFESLEYAPWDIITQLGMLVLPPSFYNSLSRSDADDPEPVTPLQSQPLVELCLRIPSWKMIENGRDRALARDAFNGHVPPQILNRHWKDRAPRFFDDLIYNNRKFSRSLLLDGMLVREGFVKRNALEEALSGNVNRGKQYSVQILDFLCTEAWILRWQTVSRRQPTNVRGRVVAATNELR